MRTLALGSYSSGTMRDEDLIPCFIDALEYVDWKRAKSYRWANRKYFNFLDGTRVKPYSDEEESEIEDTLSEITNELFDMLNEYCPPYTHFGSHIGDGADYGVWISDDSLRDAIHDGELVQVSDLSELDDMLIENGCIPLLVLEVNDHGNETLYRQGARLQDVEEVWSVV